jgi:NAD(P)-dependent dehydrogenase (short-subunit alcohol dehydrogenase family)
VSNTPFNLNDRTALVTGGGSGIGAATCRELSRAGAKVIVADINIGAAEATALSLKDGLALQLDVTDIESIPKACIDWAH